MSTSQSTADASFHVGQTTPSYGVFLTETIAPIAPIALTALDALRRWRKQRLFLLQLSAQGKATSKEYANERDVFQKMTERLGLVADELLAEDAPESK